MHSPDHRGPDVVTLERRQAERKHVIQRVQILGETSSVEAVMLDVSETGAQLQLRSPAELPQSFTLRFHDGGARVAEIRWRCGLKIGAHFLPDAVETPVLPGRWNLSDIRSWIERLRNVELEELFHRLAQDDHFGSEDIRMAARDLDLSVARLRRAVQQKLR